MFCKTLTVFTPTTNPSAYRDIPRPAYRHFAAPRHLHTSTPTYRHTSIPPHSHTPILPHFHTVLLSRLACLFLMLAASCGAAQAAANRPAVLFATGWVHNTYAAQPLVKMGVEVDSCPPDQLAARLATKKYNVVVASTLNGAGRQAVTEFLGQGGGALILNPEDAYASKEWTPMNQWLAQLGARPRWEVLADSDPANLAVDVMGCRLSWSSQVSPPVNEGVRGVLTLTWNGTTGCEPPMSFDFGPEWQTVVRGAPTLKGVPESRNDEQLQPWIPKQPVVASPALMGIRSVGPGRLAVEGIRSSWLFTPPYNCPTAEAMLTAGAAGKPSDWLQVFANTFRWLAQPSLAAGMGGAVTPSAVLNPPVKEWEAPPLFDWARVEPAQDEPQVKGLIGARTALSSGHGSVADYVKAAKAAGLQFIVFLEDSLKMDQGRWDQLVQECTAASDDTFAAVPGLTYEDAQGDHLYAFADHVRFPKPAMLLADGRLATTQPMRSRAYFDYVNELMQQEDIGGFWDHKQNYLHYADYKLYNSFPIYSFQDGAPIDNALDPFLYLQGLGGCHAALAFEFMTSPDMVAKRAAAGWKVVCNRSPKDLATRWHEGAWSFSGSGSQYITNGPSILVWDSPNRLSEPNGQWWRPDLWEYRLRLKVASDLGLKSVTIHDGDKEVFRQWLPAGAKTFQQDLTLSNCQQRGFTLIVEDMQGHRAISMSFWNRNLNMEEFFCSDRCNFLGSARLRTLDGGQQWTPVGFAANMGITPSKGRMDMSVSPAVSLAQNAPTLPIDGAPAGFPTASLHFAVQMPGEVDDIFAYPHNYLVSPEISIGQADIKLGYDPAEKGAKATPLGHPYQQPQDGSGNAWGSWHHLVPTRMMEGYSRTYATNWLTKGFRLGWHETQVRLKQPLTIDPDKGLPVMSTGGDWILHSGGKVITTTRGKFERGTFFTLADPGGSVVLMPMDGPLEYRYQPGKNGSVQLVYQPGKAQLAAGEIISFRTAFAGAAGGLSTDEITRFAEDFGAAEPGKVGYTARLSRGKLLDNYLLWHLDGQEQGVQAHLPRANLPAFLTACVENLHDDWSAYLLERGAGGVRFRGIPVRNGQGYAEINAGQGDTDLFIGHPITADNPQVKLLVSWQQPGVWSVEAHNPTAKPISTHLTASPGWPLFQFKEQVQLPAGSSHLWTIHESSGM